MPGPTIDDAFITRFNRDTHLMYQQRQSKFRMLVRTDAEVNGKDVRFQKLGTMTVSGKARNGDIPIQNPEHTHVDCTLLDRYGAVLIDQLDLTKLNTEVRSGYVYNMSAAFARETDDQIIDALDAGATTSVGSYSGGMTSAIALLSREGLDDNSVDSDGRVYCAVTPRQWSHMMQIDEFKSADFIGYDNLPWKNVGLEMKLWNRAYWFQTNRLPGVKTSQARCFMWHWRSVGHAIGAEVDVTWDWENLKKGWSGAGSMSMNAVVIDANGVIEIRVDDTAALS
jgi:Phage capsid protein